VPWNLGEMKFDAEHIRHNASFFTPNKARLLYSAQHIKLILEIQFIATADQNFK